MSSREEFVLSPHIHYSSLVLPCFRGNKVMWRRSTLNKQKGGMMPTSEGIIIWSQPHRSDPKRTQFLFSAQRGFPENQQQQVFKLSKQKTQWFVDKEKTTKQL